MEIVKHIKMTNIMRDEELIEAIQAKIKEVGEEEFWKKYDDVLLSALTKEFGCDDDEQCLKFEIIG